jgi:hypothetical protein
MGLRGKVGALARGEVPTASLNSYSAANQDAYNLLERVETEGAARLAAWCAFVLQIHADNLAGSGSTPGYCDPEVHGDATFLYELAAGWLDRARTAQLNPDNALDVIVPQPYPRLHGSQNATQLSALRRTVETVESRLGAALATQRSGTIEARLRPTMPALQAALDGAAGMSRGREPNPELMARVVHALLAALGRGYEAGQVLAMPNLIADLAAATPTGPSATSSATLQMFLPGDPGFDRWCLTDPIKRFKWTEEPGSIAMLDAFWEADPEPAKTLALQAQIAAALEAGTIDYMPEAAASLRTIARKCPWPGVLYSKGDLSVGEEQIETGDQFVLAVGSDEEAFQRRIVRVSARTVAQLLHENARSVDDDFNRRDREAASEEKASRGPAPGETDGGGFQIQIDISF